METCDLDLPSFHSIWPCYHQENDYDNENLDVTIIFYIWNEYTKDHIAQNERKIEKKRWEEKIQKFPTLARTFDPQSTHTHNSFDTIETLTHMPAKQNTFINRYQQDPLSRGLSGCGISLSVCHSTDRYIYFCL